MKNTVQVSDGDNDYVIPAKLEKRFDELMDAWSKTEPYSDAWYEGAEAISKEFSQYQR